MSKYKRISLAIISIGLANIAYYKIKYRMPLKEYTNYALYMATLDDEICRYELKNLVKFPEKRDSLQYRYHLFLKMNRYKNRYEILKEIDKLEYHLNSIKKVINQQTI